MNRNKKADASASAEGVTSADGVAPDGSNPHATNEGSPPRPFTLAVDVGGTGLKAAVLGADGRLVADRVRVKTTYPLTPQHFIDVVADLVKPLPSYERISVGFPGVVRKGVILTAPHFVTSAGPGSDVQPDLVKAWKGFDATTAITERLNKATRIANDADMQGLAVRSGKGLELVITLGTGLGTALFEDGQLLPHLEFAHHPFLKGEEYNQQIGDAALHKIGLKKWRRRVLTALSTLDALINFDHCFVGGGNSRHLTGLLEEHYTIVDNLAGILGGVKLWDDPS